MVSKPLRYFAWVAVVLLLGASAIGCAQAGSVIFDMDTPRHQPTTMGEDKHPIGTVEAVPGKVGGACRFSFIEGAQSGFFTAGVQASDEWDQAQGFSFQLQGDGSANWGGLELIDGANYSLRYGYCFPLDSPDWRQIAVPWCDLVPELPAGPLVGVPNGYAPSGFGNFWFGKWWYWRDYPAISYTVDQVALEPTIAVDHTDYTPAQGGTPKLLAKLKAKEPVTIVTMGDSLSDKQHWANREVLWSELLVEKLREQFGGEVKLVNPAIGGTILTQNLVLMPTWLRDTPKPDLVTVWFGFNDWDSGMRGEQYQRMLGFAVDRIRRMTGGDSEVMLLTTCPAFERWDTMEELAGAARVVAARKRTGLADVSAAFHEAGREDAARLALYCSDKTHLGAPGHELAAETVLRAIVGP
jgi:lysophospholipase L1-like esterase